MSDTTGSFRGFFWLRFPTMFTKLVPTEVQIFIRNFPREQAWERWLGKPRNGMVTTTPNFSCQATGNSQS